MSRFFTDVANVDREAGRLFITGDDVNHIKNVLRAVPGDILVVSDGCGCDYTVAVEGFEKDRITAMISGVAQSITEPPVRVTLFQGIPKSDKMDTIIQKCVELGIAKIVPVITERTIIRFKDSKDMLNKTARWRRIAMEAAKQSNRGIIPEVTMPLKLEDAFISAVDYSMRLIPYENEHNESIKRYIAEYTAGSICFFIGPEGGFDEGEIERALEHGIKPVTLGPRILRTETAGAAVLSILMYELGGMGG